MYKMSSEAYVGFDPSDINSYGFVKGNDFGGVHSEKLIYSIVKAALNQVKIDFVYHLDEGNTNTYNYINGFMENPCTTDNTKKVKDYLRIRKITWGTESNQQMHAKYLTVNYYSGDNGADETNTILSTTGNVDSHGATGIPSGKDWVQSAILVNGHPQLMSSYNSYFDIIFENYNNQEAFKNAVRAKHSSNSLNYDDTYFSSYFTPIPLNPAGNYTYVPQTGDGSPSNGNAWDTSFNPVAKYVDEMASVPGNRYIKVNMYHLKTDNFGKKFYEKLEDIYNSESSGLKHFRFVVNTNSYNSIFPLSNFNNIGIIKSSAATHSKDVLFAFSGLSR